MPVRAGFGLYARETWLYTPARVSTSPFEPVWACTPLKPGFTPPDKYRRPCTTPFGPVHPEKRLYAPGRVCMCLLKPVWACWRTFFRACTPGKPYCTTMCRCRFVPVRARTPGKPGRTSQDECARPSRARLGLYTLETWLYATARVCTSPFVPVWACTSWKPSCTPLHECARRRSCPFGPVGPGNPAVSPCASVHVPVRGGLGLNAQKTWVYAP